MNHLLHPEIFDQLPFGAIGAEALEDRASKLDTAAITETGVTVVIRTRNEAANLEVLFDEIKQQSFKGPLQVVVVDTESSDGTKDIARQAGAEVVTISQEDFTYPFSLNVGFTAAAYENVYSTVGHANLSNTNLLRATVIDGSDQIAGAFGCTLPNANATIYDKAMFFGQVGALRKTTEISKVAMGVMGANCAVFRRSAWEELGGFDPRFEAGGEDTDLARRMLAAGMGIVQDPALAVHHSHGLGLVNTIKQYKHWWEVLHGPRPLDKGELANRRPDLSI